jgi:hypothetical protein
MCSPPKNSSALINEAAALASVTPVSERGGVTNGGGDAVGVRRSTVGDGSAEVLCERARAGRSSPVVVGGGGGPTAAAAAAIPS